MENCKRWVRAIPEDVGRPDWIDTVVQELVAVKGMRQRSHDGSGGTACDERLRCGPRRPKLRHTGTEDYASVASTARCAKRVAACGHPCVMHSGDDCRCNVVVYNLGLPCGHTLESVDCATLHGTTKQWCPVQERVELPFCKHHCTLPCAVALRLEVSLETENWTDAWDVNYACRALCDGLHPSGCGHRCRQKCSDCLEESLGDPWRATADEMLAAGQRPRHSGRGVCSQPCNRLMACGHRCIAVCHKSAQCPPCEAPCRNGCSHGECPKRCKDPCTPCIEPCAWSCTHGESVTKCELPCGSPCTRLPCDKRCTERLQPCGHQCPGLCGEPCLSSAFCRECPPSASTKHEEVVDLATLTPLALHNPNASPLARLRCGHCFTVKTLDKWLGLGHVYGRDATGNWLEVRPLQAPEGEAERAVSLRGCPTCNASMDGVRRYGRLVNYSRLYQAELKYLHDITTKIGAPASPALLELRLSRFRALATQPTPTQQLLDLEARAPSALRHNLVSFRNVLRAQPALLAGIEYLELVGKTLARCRGRPLSDKDKNRALAKYMEATTLETKLHALAVTSGAWRSASEIVMRGAQLRVGLLHCTSQGQVAQEHSTRNVGDLECTLQRCRLSRGTWTPVQRFCGLAESDKWPVVSGSVAQAPVRSVVGRWFLCGRGHVFLDRTSSITTTSLNDGLRTCAECGATIAGPQTPRFR